jgi:polyisoprenyl-teichoic acid--peptidoglycan teichoic acid transferase
VLVAAGAGVAYWQASSTLGELHAGAKGAVVRSVEPELHRPPKRALLALPPEPHAQTILLIGSDHRRSGGDGSRSDTIMLARIQPDRHRIALLSIPRDLYVAIPAHGHDRINMAYHYGGERLLTRVVRDTLGVEIDHFVEVDFHGFKDMVATLGGVWFPVDRRYYNRNVGTLETNYADIDLQPGYQKLDGEQALAFARYRHDDSDFVRAARQQLLLRTVARAAVGDRWDILRLRRLGRDVAKATTSDISSLGEALSLARAVHETPVSGIARTTLQADDLVLDGADYVASSPEQLRSTVRAWMGVRAPARAGVATAPARTPAVAPAALGADGGAGRALVASVRNGMRTCAPTELPQGYWWPSGAARSYALARHPAIALYASGGSGDSVLWMYTTWGDPPVLADPSTTVHRAGRAYDVWTSSGRIHQVAWRLGPTRVWITNALRDTLTNAQMLGLAASCR